MRFNLKQVATSVFAMAFLAIMVIGTLIVSMPEKASAQATIFENDLRYYYRVTTIASDGSQTLTIRAEFEGDVLMSWTLADGQGFNFTPATYNRSLAERHFGQILVPSSSGSGTLTSSAGLPEFHVGATASNGELEGRGYPDNWITGLSIDHASYRDAFLACRQQGAADLSACTAAGATAADRAAAEAEEAEEEEQSCETEGGVMAWIMCPVVKGIDEALNWIDEQIQALLTIDRNYYDNAGIRGAFNSVRNIAYIILVPIVLVMVIGTALNFDFISAYTVKRAMPRLVIAVIFIALSYEICVFLIEFFNAMGTATLGIITSPFAAELGDVNSLSLSNLFAPAEGVPGILSSLMQFIIGAPVVLIILWLFGGTLLLFAGSAFLVLLLRQIFIVVFLLAAPLAILAWIFPGNDKLWKMWWGSFSKLLLMFPLIMAIIAVGRIFAFTIHEGGGAGLDGTVLQPIMTLVAYMIPYAFIPFTFKFAGGLFATMSGMVNDRSKGMFDRQRQSRAGKIKRVGEGNAFKNAGPKGIRSKLNTFGAGAMNLDKAGIGFSPKSWRPKNMGRSVRTAMGSNSIAQALDASQNNESYQSWVGDDDLNKAANLAATKGTSIEKELQDMGYAGYGKEGQDQKRAKEAISMAAARVNRTKKEVGNDALKQMTWLAANKGGTSFKTAEEAWQAAADSSGGDDAVLATLVARGRADAMAAGRVDIGGAGFGDTFTAAKGLRDKTLTSDQARAQIHRGVIESQGPGVLSHSSMKPTAIKELVPELKERVAAAASSGDQDAYDRELAMLSSLHDSMAASSPQNARILADQVLNWDPRASGAQQPLPPGVAGPVQKGGVTVFDDMQGRRHSRVFQATHRELTAEQSGAGAVGGGAAGGPGGPAPPPTAPGGP